MLDMYTQCEIIRAEKQPIQTSVCVGMPGGGGAEDRRHVLILQYNLAAH